MGDLEKTSKNLRNSKTPFLPAAKANTDLMEPRGFASASTIRGDVDFRIGIVVMRRMFFALSGGKRFPPLLLYLLNLHKR